MSPAFKFGRMPSHMAWDNQPVQQQAQVPSLSAEMHGFTLNVVDCIQRLPVRPCNQL